MPKKKKKKHKCRIPEKLKEESRKLIKSLEDKGYCIIEAMTIINLAEASLRDGFIIDHILEHLEEKIKVKIMTNPKFQREMKEIKNFMEGNAG